MKPSKRVATGTTTVEEAPVLLERVKATKEGTTRSKRRGGHQISTPLTNSSRSSSKSSKPPAEESKAEGKTVESVALAPQTPESTHMDSDDELHSPASSGGFNMDDDDQNSDISIDDGTLGQTRR